MATIGLKMPVFAPHKNELEDGIRPEYDNGFIIGRGIKAELNLNYADATLYADDILVEEDSSFQNGTIDVGVDEISNEVYSKLFGARIVEVDGVEEIHKGAGDKPVSGGFGYYKTKVIKKVPGFLAKWFLNVKFKPGNDTAETKGDSTNFQTPEFSGNVFAVPGLDQDTYVEEAFFSTESEAQAWLRKKANISSSRVAVQSFSAPATTSSTTSVTPKSTSTSSDTTSK